MNKYVLEYYERLLLWIEAMRFAGKANSLVAKLGRKEEELDAGADPSAADFDDAAFHLADGSLSACEILLRNAVTYGHKNLGLEPYYLSDAALPLLVEDLIQNSVRLSYYADRIRNACKDAAKHDDHQAIAFEEIERDYAHKTWRKRRINDGLGAGGNLFEQEWANGIGGRPPLRETIPWLEAWLSFNTGKNLDNYITIEG